MGSCIWRARKSRFAAGWHPFYEAEGPEIRHIRREPIRFAGYSIGYRRGVDRKWHASVRINSEQYNVIKGYFLDVCTRRSVEQISKELQIMPFEAYAPVRRQMLNILRAVNRKRRTAGLAPVGMEAVRFRRRILKPFVGGESRALEVERHPDTLPLRENEFSDDLSKYRQLERGPRSLGRGIQR